MLGGVASGLAGHLGLSVRAMRIAFVLTSFMGGAGLLLYVWLWAFVPSDRGVPSPGIPARPPDGPYPSGRAAGLPGAQVPGRTALRARREGRRSMAADVMFGVGLLCLGLYLLAARAGWSVNPGLVIPLAVVGLGVVVAFSQLDEVERARWVERASVGTQAAVLRLAGGVVLVVVGVLLIVVQGSADLGQLGRTLLASVAVLGGAGLVLAPWGVRLWRDLDAERAARVREAERADIAAHLHDSVLQTLTLIQRRSTDAAEVARLARAQERDLRSWLYGAPPSNVATLSAAVAEAAADAEDLYGAVVEVVTVGDRQLDERGGALVAALREALANAARHAGGTISLYVEAGPDGVEAFVRDRGPGFDIAAVPTDRSGLRESVIARMERHGGSARVVSAPGEGTEVKLFLPDAKPDAKSENKSENKSGTRQATEPDAGPRTEPDVDADAEVA